MSHLSLEVKHIRLLPFMRRFRSNPLGTLGQLQQEHGDFVAVPVIPGLTNYMIFSPDLAYSVLVERTSEFKKADLGRRLLAATFGNGLFFSEGEFWYRQRKLAQPAFHHVGIRVYAEHMITRTHAIATQWAASSQPLDLVKAMRALTLSIVVDALFSTEMSSLTDEIGQAMSELAQALLAQTLNIVDTVMPPWVPTAVNHHKRHALATLDPIIMRLITERRAAASQGNDLLSMFLNARDLETGEQMTDQQVRDEVMTMFIAGHETSAVALSWALIELLCNPPIMDRLRAELDGVLNGRPVQVNDLPNLPYLQGIVKEVLRKYPPVTFLSRQALQPLKIGESDVPPSALINVMVYNIHQDPRWYTAPEQFNPDRWTPEWEKTLPKCAYLPFGAGPRTCIGNGFARLEMQLVLATFVQQLDLRADSLLSIEPMFGLTLGFSRPIFVHASTRPSADAKRVLDI